ncbi:MAG: PLP-dependent aspartate aminotransferase family protein [Helicobacteraceae bacterium]|jgi:cystathionine beta-lyase/cystathionine gamma-synthase|nr:PLP-dependent aspartate aminotransferase family protein [Helicobacteraceae bacterium]
MKQDTKLIHGGFDRDRITGAINASISVSSTFDQMDVSGEQEYDYARSSNPTRKALEETIAFLEGGLKGYAFSSGMAAIASILGIFSAGDHIVTAEDIYGGSYRILNTFYRRWNLEHTAVNASDAEAIKRAIRPGTKALFLETPSNPLLKITDLRTAIAIAREKGLLTIVDNTFMTPLLQRPIEFGADIVVHSATKFLGGHSDVIFGLAVAATEKIGKLIYAVQNGFGAVPSSFDCFLVLRGIKTLKARMSIEEQNARKLALFLQSHREIDRVFYPEFSDEKNLHISQAEGFGAVFSFETKTLDRALDFLKKTRLCARAVSLGGVETIASYPVRMSHAAMPPAQREKLGISERLIRISAGLENIDDLMEDFERALR